MSRPDARPCRAATLLFALILSALTWAPLPAVSAASSPAWRFQTLKAPPRVQVLDASGVVATFTNGARTVNVRGPVRTLAEPGTTSATVTGATRVRLLPTPFTGTVDRTWLEAALADSSPDVLALSLQYVAGAPTTLDAAGRVVSGDASYGPLQPDGTRQEGSDFNDYLGVRWEYDAVADLPEATQLGSLDCSGFVRMVMGYRSGLAMTLDPDGVRLPRRAHQMLSSAPGRVTVASTGAQPTSTAGLAPGDLLFFDASTDDGTAVDHVGLYLGVDSTGSARFISSRKTADGPTLGDVGGRSTVTGTGHYARAWRAARRL
ncbi:NlpC/P60 family protein [Nocardioides sp.]|uniref:NlpC/P60 family protein n=1 Tax=Nocardioides sp. TaxID=35761 RepID=UPI002C931973|nr:NlpC/P60 family protein [Nocardioides sp.]HXH80236.1 NlpC/P60 family protein [Nocardioides sp.]